MLVLAAAALPLCAQVPPLLKLDAQNGNSVAVDSTGAVFASGNASAQAISVVPGFISFSATLGGFTVASVKGSTKPLANFPPPAIDIEIGQITNTNLAAGTITASFTDSAFAATGPETLTVLGPYPTVTYSAYFDTNNAPNTFFGTDVFVGSIQNPLGAGTTANFDVKPATTSPISMVVVATINIAAGGSFTSGDFGFNATKPQPSTTCGGATCPPVVRGDAATIGFWHNKNGQAVILATAPGLPLWLKTQFPSLYGSYSLTTNADVAALFQTFFNVTGAKTYAQVLGGALACYVTSTTLGASTTQGASAAAQFGFNLSTTGTCGHAINVGNYGTAIGLMNNQSYSVLQLLQQANIRKLAGTFNANAFNAIFDSINQTGDIR